MSENLDLIDKIGGFWRKENSCLPLTLRVIKKGDVFMQMKDFA